MRRLVVSVIVFLVALACPAFGRAGDDFAWHDLAGMEEELQGQVLELRDELIPAHLSYLEALEKAIAQIDSLSAEGERRRLAWARVEYLLETSFRLLDGSGEYAAFLKTTEPLKPSAFLPPEPVDLDAPAADGPADGGLAYAGAEGRRLTVENRDDGPVLLDSDTGEAFDADDGVVAGPAGETARAGEAHVNFIKARASWLRALALERWGKADEARAETEGLAFIRDWAFLGPLDAASEDYSLFRYMLEELYDGLAADTEYSGKLEKVSWRPLAILDPLGRTVPGGVMRSGGGQSAYFLALVHSPDDMRATAHFGSNAASALFVNHFAAGRVRASERYDPDQETASVWLRRGWNAILVRTASDDVGNGWSFAVRLTDAAGRPFPGYVARPDDENLDAFLGRAASAARRSRLERFFAPSAPADAGGVTVLSQWLEKRPDDARGNFYCASLLVARRMMEGPERFDRELIFRRAMEHADSDPFFTLMAARSIDSGVEGPDREENLRLVLLRSVADKGSAAALVDIGRLYLDVMRQPRRADEYAEMALSVNPMSLRAGVLDYDVAIAQEWEPVAGVLLGKLVNRHPTAAAARLRLGRAALAKGRHRQALTEFHAILAVDADNREALNGAVTSLGMLGQTSAAVDLLAEHIRSFPYDFYVRRKLADLYRVLGRDDDAARVVFEALAVAPDDPVMLAMRKDLTRGAQAAAGAAAAAATGARRQELDTAPAAEPPANGWEYLYFQVEDVMEPGGGIRRTVAFAVKVYTRRAARVLRHLGYWRDVPFEKSSVRRIDIIDENGAAKPFVALPEDAARGEIWKHLPPLRPGSTIEAEIEINRERVPFLGDYFGYIAFLSQQAPVRLSRYMFTAPSERKVFFKPANGAPEAMVVASPDGKSVTRIWEMANLPAYTVEPWSQGLGELVPCIQVSSFGDWNEFARWYWRLIGAQYHAPPELRDLAVRVGAGAGVPLAKLDRAATWVSRNIGHRPWEYGPYAFRPINARSILSRLSADGKDRTLLLCLLAREYGIEAWPVLARMRDARHAPVGSAELSLPLLENFNHSLALVRSTMGGDVFMDASNPYRPSGVMPSQLFGSPGIAVSPTGAQRIHIPDAGATACEWLESADMIVDEDGSILWEEKITGVGTAAEALRRRFREEGETDDAWTAYLRSIGGDPSTATDSFHDAPAEPSAAEWSGRARLRRWATVEGGRVVLAVPPLPGGNGRDDGARGYPLRLEDMAKTGERRHALLLPHGFRVSRQVNVVYPPEWRLVNPSRSFERAYPFGSVSLKSEHSPGGMALEFTVEVSGHRVSAQDFPAFREMAALAERWLRAEFVWEKP